MNNKVSCPENGRKLKWILVIKTGTERDFFISADQNKYKIEK